MGCVYIKPWESAGKKKKNGVWKKSVDGMFNWPVLEVEALSLYLAQTHINSSSNNNNNNTFSHAGWSHTICARHNSPPYFGKVSAHAHMTQWQPLPRSCKTISRRKSYAFLSFRKQTGKSFLLKLREIVYDCHTAWKCIYHFCFRTCCLIVEMSFQVQITRSNGGQ